MSAALSFNLQTGGGLSPIDVPISGLVIAGWTGRDFRHAPPGCCRRHYRAHYLGLSARPRANSPSLDGPGAICPLTRPAILVA